MPASRPILRPPSGAAHDQAAADAHALAVASAQAGADLRALRTRLCRDAATLEQAAKCAAGARLHAALRALVAEIDALCAAADAHAAS